MIPFPNSSFLLLPLPVASPRSARSRYVNEEVRHFRQLGRGDRIVLPLPNSSFLILPSSFFLHLSASTPRPAGPPATTASAQRSSTRSAPMAEWTPPA